MLSSYERLCRTEGRLADLSVRALRDGSFILCVPRALCGEQ